jgi:copper transport protein
LPYAVAAAALVSLSGPAPASAHAVLEHSSPAADAVLPSQPGSVVLVFDEAVSLLPDSLRVYGPDGGEVDDGHVGHAGSDAATVTVGLRSGAPEGSYLVSYRVVSADSHPVSGAYTFAVGHRSVTPAVSSQDGATSVAVVLGVSRWVSYAGSALGLGGLVFLAWLWPAGWASRRARALVAAGVGALVVGTFSSLALKGPYDGGLGLGHVADGDLLREVLGTTYGRALEARLLLLAVLVLLLTYRERVPRRALACVAPLLLLGVGMTFALGGHAAAGGHRLLALASVTVHVAAMSVWLGGLAVLATAALAESAETESALPVVRRFSTVAATSVAVLLATGTYQAVREVRSWDVLLDSHYGRVLLVKLWLVVVVLGAAAGSRAWLWQRDHPAAESAGPSAAPRRPPVRSLRGSVALEGVALAAVLVASALLVTSNPKVSSLASAPVSATVRTGPDTVRVRVVPDGVRAVRLRLQVLDDRRRPVEPREVQASFTLADQQVGPLEVRLSRAGPGLRTGRVGLPLAGRWQLAVTVRTSAIDEATGYVAVPVG